MWAADLCDGECGDVGVPGIYCVGGGVRCVGYLMWVAHLCVVCGCFACV